ncbi:hypothetical protein PPL_10059 [Heterostelium album PN500]|uniref:F5/8 type C domain-containing protein n=1 Tax=Heterostelium pallidum (strain ATCC 26659 / Pp 5 / PN500) TaxID=670386 RepID=D3BQ76_HETP5|nr:hypothetical protein PPL_10059 [Heterostelium album PN500]EFA76296.1 hypothetical protein PPL_10059 [Heterostelium album PN500]|eukprot:XP_020428428.1 hypothetical protein PPL_10059 [Heterostelium album PN500]
MSYNPGVSTGQLNVSHSSAITSNFTINGATINANKCWHPAASDTNPSVTASISTGIAEIGSIQLQGRPDADQWVTSFTLKYTLDGVNWKDYNNGTAILTGLNDRNTPQTLTLAPPLRAQSVTLYPSTFNGSRALRWEINYKPIPRQTITNFEYGLFSTRDGNFPKLYDGSNGDKRYEIQVKFQTGFIRPPFVSSSLHNINMSKTGQSFKYSFIPHDITEDGFTMLIRTWDENQLEEISFNWLAFEISQ